MCPYGLVDGEVGADGAMRVSSPVAWLASSTRRRYVSRDAQRGTRRLYANTRHVVAHPESIAGHPYESLFDAPRRWNMYGVSCSGRDVVRSGLIGAPALEVPGLEACKCPLLPCCNLKTSTIGCKASSYSHHAMASQSEPIFTVVMPTGALISCHCKVSWCHEKYNNILQGITSF